MDDTLQGSQYKDDLHDFVEKSRRAFDTATGETDGWQPNDRCLVEGVNIKRLTIEETPKIFTIGRVTQMVGVVIPSHRHHESHVLLKVIEGAIQVECEGYSRKVEAGFKDLCLIPRGFAHTVYALANADNKPAVYLSAHGEEWLTIDDNNFLRPWPEDDNGNKLTELQAVREQISWFLSLQEQYLTDYENYRAWFYLTHYDQDLSLHVADKSGLVGSWSRHEQQYRKIREDYRRAESFRVGTDLADPGWVEKKEYCYVFVAHKDKAEAEAVSPYNAYYNSSESKWVISRPSSVQVRPPNFKEDALQEYMQLLTAEFLPGTSYIAYITAPQQPGLSGYAEECQRRPFTSFVVGMTHGCPVLLRALTTFYLLCSSVIQQQKFAARADVTKIRYEEEQRQKYFINHLMELLIRKTEA